MTTGRNGRYELSSPNWNGLAPMTSPPVTVKHHVPILLSMMEQPCWFPASLAEAHGARPTWNPVFPH